jgi:hypothetical protein
MNYGNLVKRPFEIVARRPYLWLLGILAGGATTFNWSGSNAGYSRNHPASGWAGYQGPGPNWQVVQNLWNDNFGLIVGVLAVLLVVGIVLFVLGCIATGAIVHAAVEHDAGRDYKLGAAWRAGYASGWRIAGLRVLTFLLAIVPGLLVGALVVATVAGVSAQTPAAILFGLTAGLAFLASIVFWLALSVAYQLAQRIVVLEDGQVAASLSAGFRMLRSHFVPVALGWLLLLALSIGAGIAMAVLAVVAAVPAVTLGVGGFFLGGPIGGIVLGTFAAVFFLGVLVAAGAAYAAYSSVFWTLLFKNLRELPEPSPGGAMVPA